MLPCEVVYLLPNCLLKKIFFFLSSANPNTWPNLHFEMVIAYCTPTITNCIPRIIEKDSNIFHHYTTSPLLLSSRLLYRIKKKKRVFLNQQKRIEHIEIDCHIVSTTRNFYISCKFSCRIFTKICRKCFSCHFSYKF